MKADAQPSAGGKKRQKLVRRLDETAIARILDRTKVKLPAKFDRSEFCWSVNGSLSVLTFNELDGTKAIQAQRQKRITEIEDCARRILRALTLPSGDPKLDTLLADAFRRYFGESKTDPSADPLPSTISHLAWLIERLRAIEPGRPFRERVGGAQSMVLFIAALSECYKTHLGLRAGRYRVNGTGPFTRFVRAVMEEAGLPAATNSSIDTYVKRARKWGQKYGLDL